MRSIMSKYIQKMMWLQWLLVILCFNFIRQAVCGNICATPEDRVGQCIPLKSCPYLHKLMLADGRNPTTIDYLRKSHCEQKFENCEPVVCCANSELTTTSRPSNSKQKETCGKSTRPIEVRHSNKMDANLGEWPWMVALGYKSSSTPTLDFKCGATLISNQWVITAAHCVKDLETFQLTTARLGDLDLDPDVIDNAMVVDEPIEEIIPHPEYTSDPITNDIALLRLKNTVNFTKYIQPICILSGQEYRSDPYYRRKRPYIMGWGAFEWRGASSTKLQYSSANIINQTQCASVYAQEERAIIDHRVICAGEKGKDTCQGDSGGSIIFPMVFEGRNRPTFFLGGIVSFGVRCADLTYPGVYTRVAAFTDWISKITGLPLN